MKKLIYFVAIVASLLLPTLAGAGSAAAVNVFPPCTSNAKSTDVCGDVNVQTKANTNPIAIAMKALLELMSIIAGVAATVMLIISGLRFITSGGDPGGVKSAREGMQYVVIGILVILTAQLIVAFVINKL
jgi:hypothetical protein